MKTVGSEEFDAYVAELPADETVIGHDVGRTHGIACYSVRGKTVAVSRWVRDGMKRVFTFEIAGVS